MISEKEGFRLPLGFDHRKIRVDGFAFAALFILLMTIYANSFESAWQYDDYLNIVQNTNIRLEELSWQNLLRTFHGVKRYDADIVRPVAFFTFALNYYAHKYNVVGYHIVNFGIHFFASIFLYLFIKTTLRLPACRGDFDNSAEAVALLAALFWASHPIHVTAVTYIVQRMACMAGMFYIMAMYFFVKARTISGRRGKYSFWGLCILSGLLAFGSKENAIMLPISIFLFDILLLQSPSQSNRNASRAIAVLLVLLLLGLSVYYVDWPQLQQSFDNRPFSLQQRLLTEPRVIVFYLSLLFYPTTSRLTLLHDIPVSSGWSTPWTTMPAILFIAFLVGVAVIWRRKYPFPAYCIIFFFLNHLVEGSVIAIELVYEHRNYLPSMLIFVLPAMAIVKVLDYFAYRPALQGLAAFCAAFVLWAHAHTTHCFNRVFTDELSLWEDNVEKSPALSVTHNNFGQALSGAGDPDRAGTEFEIALKLDRYNNNRQRGVALYNLGLHTAYEKKSYHKALELFGQALRYLPSHPELIQHSAQVALIIGQTDTSAQLLQRGHETWPNHPGLIQVSALLDLSRNQPAQAFYQAARIYHGQSPQLSPLFIMATACRMRGEISISISYWEKVMRKDPANPLGAFALAALYHRVQKRNDRDLYLGLLRYLKREKTWKDYWGIVRQAELNRFFMPGWHEIQAAVGDFNVIDK